MIKHILDARTDLRMVNLLKIIVVLFAISRQEVFTQHFKLVHIKIERSNEPNSREKYSDKRLSSYSKYRYNVDLLKKT